MFEQAVRLKLRFQYCGTLTTEDLWDLHVKDLDQIFKDLSVEARQADEESLLDTRTNANKRLDLSIEVVKHIVATKLEEQAKREAAADRKVRKQTLLGILEDKENQALLDLTADELRGMIADLN